MACEWACCSWEMPNYEHQGSSVDVSFVSTRFSGSMNYWVLHFSSFQQGKRDFSQYSPVKLLDESAEMDSRVQEQDNPPIHHPVVSVYESGGREGEGMQGQQLSIGLSTYITDIGGNSS